MSLAAKRDVEQLLALSPELATPACPVGSFEDGATWADCVRARYRERFAATATWHYVDVAVCRPFALPDDGDARFIVERYRRELAVLSDRRNPPLARLEALLWVEHLLGDLHQPLHVGDAGDRGGNEVTVEGGAGRSPRNLHAEWDRNLVEDSVRNDSGGVAGLVAAADDGGHGRGWHVDNPATWAGRAGRLRGARLIHTYLSVLAAMMPAPSLRSMSAITVRLRQRWRCRSRRPAFVWLTR